MPFEPMQTLFRVTVPEYKEIKQRRVGAGKAAGHSSRSPHTRRGAFVRMPVNSSVSLIHGQRLRQVGHLVG